MKHILQRIIFASYLRKALHILAVCFCVTLTTGIVSTTYALSGEVTSDPGNRVDPVTGLGTEDHAGMDIAGMPEGEAVDSPVSGTVINASDIGDGYGISVVIAMDGGGLFRLGHNSDVTVATGDRVHIGQIVALAGSTGKSTGVHVHAEWRPLATGMDDSYTTPYGNPGPILLAAGWQLNGYTGQGIVRYVKGSLKNFFEKALSAPLNLNIDYIYKLGTSIRTALENITKGCIKAMQSLVDVSLPLLGVLAVIDVTMFIWRGPAITGQLESSFWTGMMQRLVKYGFLAFLISMWPTVINKVFIGTDQTLLTQFSSTTAGAMSDITAPDLQLQHFLSFLNPSITWLGGLSVKGMFDHMGLFLLNMFITYTSMILFIILIFWLIVTYIEFYVSAIFSVFSLSFAGLKPTTFISEGMVSHLINSTIKLLCVGVVYAIMRHNMELFAYSATDALDILKAFTMVITAVVVGLLLPQRIADGLSVQAKL